MLALRKRSSEEIDETVVFQDYCYAEALLEELPALNWPDKIKTAQENWIGKSQGAEITFCRKTKAQLTVFSTRPDTVFGATFLVLAPEHPLALELTNADTYEVVKLIY